MLRSIVWSAAVKGTVVVVSCIGAVALIDDSIDYARQCAESGLPVFLIGQYAWNRSSEELSPLITRVHTWRMVAQLVTPELIDIART